MPSSLLNAMVLISSEKLGRKYGDQVKKRGTDGFHETRYVQPRRDESSLLNSNSRKGQEDYKQPCCFAVLCGLQGVLVCASSPRTTTQVEHDIVSWQARLLIPAVILQNPVKNCFG
jgi:hypothetical protein